MDTWEQELRLVSRYRHAKTTNVLLLHGSPERRDRVARAFHAAGTGPASSFHRLDCRHEEDSFRLLIRDWMILDGREVEPAVMLQGPQTTLFLDVVEALSPEGQKLLLTLIERLADATAEGSIRPIGRLIAGCRVDPRRAVEAGSFLPELHDSLNKARIDLRRRNADSRVSAIFCEAK